MSDLPPKPQPGFSNYPRAASFSNGLQRPPAVYFDSIKVACRLVVSNIRVWGPSMALSGALIVVVSAIFKLAANLLEYGLLVGNGEFNLFNFGLLGVIATIIHRPALHGPCVLRYDRPDLQQLLSKPFSKARSAAYRH